MENIFCSYHPPKCLKNERGLFKKFFNVLKENYLYYKDTVLHLVTRVFCWFCVRTMNKLAKFKTKTKKETKIVAKKNTKSSPITLRGKIQLAARSH